LHPGSTVFFYEKHLPDNGFEIEDLQMNGNFFEFLAQENRRIKRVAKQYTGKKINLLDKVFIHGVLWTLERLSKKAAKSAELLSYGVHVFARKVT
jgi:hypothetical protein